jgi:signal transduction histidine kinase
MEVASAWLLLTVAVLLLLFYLAMLYLVRNAQRLIDAEARAREQAVLREQAWHRDKVATMGAMAANISHEVGNPLAIISGLAQEIGHWRAPADFSPEMPRMIVEQTARIAAMTRRISDFATAGRETPEALDVNEQVRAVCDFLSFDRRFRGTPVSLRLAQRLPACTAIRDHLIEVLMELLQGLKEAAASSGEAAHGGRRIEVETAAGERQVLLRIGFVGEPGHASCALPPHDARIEAARQRVEAMGGRIVPTPAGLEIQLPAAA